MSQKITDEISCYIEFLEGLGYKISLSLKKDIFEPFSYQLLKYDIHDHAICDYLKQNPGTAGRCVSNKKRLLAKDILRPYYACCYAGVEEFLIPVRYDGKMLGCIYVSGYRGRLPRSRRFMEKTASLCDRRFSELYSSLSEDVPKPDTVLSFARPLGYMLTELYRSCSVRDSGAEESSASKNLYMKALQFIYENFSTALNCDKLAEQLRYSSSYLRYIFKKEGNTSVQAKITQIRIEKAQRLLRGGNMSVTDIAFSIGFEDSNYFSYVFKKQTGVSPLAYRKLFK
jgi:AraC-like DNA-binding protein